MMEQRRALRQVPIPDDMMETLRRAATAVDAAHFAFIGPTLVLISKSHLKMNEWQNAKDAAQEALNVENTDSEQDAR